MLAIPFILLLIGLGALMVKAGRWPRRVGESLHCANCDYILVDEPAKCPECGKDVRRGNVVRGARQRKPALVWLGVVLGILGLGLFGKTLYEQVDWYQYKPFGWVLKDYGNGSAIVSAKAWTEINRRLDEKSVSEANLNALVEKGLQLQSSGVAMSGRGSIYDFLGQRYLDKKLTAGQTDRFLANALKVTFFVRPVVGTESRLPYSVAFTGVGPDDWSMDSQVLGFSIDGGPFENGATTNSGQSGGWMFSSTLDPIGTAGIHRLRLKLALSTGPRTPSTDDRISPLPGQRTTELAADFYVVDGATPMATITSPGANALLPYLSATAILWPKREQMERQLALNVRAGGFPLDAAFKVFVRINGQEYPSTSLHFQKGTANNWGLTVTKIPETGNLPVDVIFRSDENVARETTNLTQIWKGEIILPNVPVSRP